MATAGPVAANPPQAFDVPSGRLGDVIGRFGAQANVSIGVSDPAAGRTHVHKVKGRMTIGAALDRLLEGTRLGYIAIDSQSFRIILRPTTPARAPAPILTVAPIDIASADILVVASKRNTPLPYFAGTVSILDGEAAAFSRTGASGTDALVDALPSLGSTHLGPGRNKLIIRGIADSSFTGPTQAIVGQYLGDIRLNYDAPDPDLTLYDMNRAEILEGPQGTLYGAGSLGGIIRLIPNPPDLNGISAAMTAGISPTQGGGTGDDAAGMINLPLRDDVAGLRGVVYRSIDGGYIADAQRGLTHINRSQTLGGRIALRIEPGNDWAVDLGAMVQSINNADSQYAERTSPKDTRRSAIPQPFDNDYRLGQITVSRNWQDLRFMSATGVVNHVVDERYDATAFHGGVPTAYDQSIHILLISNENRLSRQSADGTGWLIGTTFISNDERITRDLGMPASPQRIAGIHNAVIQGALYGEATLRLARTITVTGGGRIAYSKLSGDLLDVGRAAGEPTRTEVEVLPSLAIAWRPLPRLTAYLRYQEGFRPGGLSIAASPGGVVSQRYHGDNIATFEGGARYGNPDHDRFSGSIGLSYAHWEHIQADLVNSNGLPITANLGTGRILGLEAKGSWRVLPGLIAEASLFLNDSELIDPAPGFENTRKSELPDVAEVGARGAVTYKRKIDEKLSLSIDASIRYFGRSRLGVGPLLDIPQGNYADTAIGARIGSQRIGVSIDMSNILNSAGNRFSLGNPFGVMDRQQTTPQQPRTIRIGLDGHF